MKTLAALLLFAGCQAIAAPQAPPSSPRTPSATATSAAPAPAVAPNPALEIGSLKNARVAIPRGPGARALTYFAQELPPGQVREMASVAPGVRFVVGLSREEALARAAEADAIDGYYATPEFLRAAGHLVWVQAGSAGVERFAGIPELANPRVVLTNMRGVHGPVIAEHAFAMLLALTRDLPVHLAGRARGAWNREGSGVLHPVSLHGRTLLVVGLGGIGSEIAQLGHAFGMRVLATRRTEGPVPPFVSRVGKPGDLRALLPEADVVAIAAPLTPETEHLFDAAAFAAMKRGSYLVNVARGREVVTDALLAALRSGRLAGACLDVTDPEPLPADHPLWQLPNVVITPHVAAEAELTEERAAILWRENVRRFDAGEPLLNVVDVHAGY